MADLLELGEQVAPPENRRVRSPNSPRATISASSPSGNDAFAHADLRPGRTSAPFARIAVGRSRKTSTSPLRCSWRLGLFRPMGSAWTPARWPNRRAGKTRESFKTRQSPGCRNGEFAEPAVFPAASAR